MPRMKNAGPAVCVKRGKGNTKKPRGILALHQYGRPGLDAFIKGLHARIYSPVDHPFQIGKSDALHNHTI